jgi:hypothetical protein
MIQALSGASYYKERNVPILVTSARSCAKSHREGIPTEFIHATMTTPTKAIKTTERRERGWVRISAERIRGETFAWPTHNKRQG